MGRITKSFRVIFKEQLRDLRGFHNALMEASRRDAFDSLKRAWSSELGAMSYARIPYVLDAMLLTGLIDNRKLIEELYARFRLLESKVEKLASRLNAVPL